MQESKLLHLLQFSRFGAMALLFAYDSLPVSVSPKRVREDLLKYFGRLLKDDVRADRTTVLDSITARALGVQAQGLDAVRRAMGEDHMIHPDAWHGVACEIAETLAPKKPESIAA